MVPGQIYYLLIDGLSGDECDINVKVSPVDALVAGAVGAIGPMTPDVNKICVGGTAIFQVPPVENAGLYTWSGPPGLLVNDQPAPLTLRAPEGQSVKISFPPGLSGKHQVCVTASNSCQGGKTLCKEIDLQPIPVTVLPDSIIYTTAIKKDTIIEYNLSSFEGCDSIVRQKYRYILPPNIHLIKGKLLFDLNQNCVADASDLPATGVLVKFSGSSKYAKPSDDQGEFEFWHPDTGTVRITLDTLPGLHWQVCDSNYVLLRAGTKADTNVVQFLLRPNLLCPALQVQLGMQPFFRPCSDAQARVRYCNIGTESADSVAIELILPPTITLASATIPIAQQKGDTLYFNLGKVQPLDCGDFMLNLKTACDSKLIGRTECLKAHIYPDTFCTNWLGAFIHVKGKCVGDSSILFELGNKGPKPSAFGLEYIIVEDEVVLRHNPFQLNPGETDVIKQRANGATWRIEVPQEPGRPGRSRPAISVEGCGGLNNRGLVNAFYQDDADEFVDIECREFTDSYSSNMKMASPSGVGSGHLIGQSTPIEYNIHFKNVGNDTAFYVRVLDTIANELDISTLQPGASSHPCSWQILNDRVLEVVFDPVALPDSSTNDFASGGWFEFTIEQKAGLPKGTRLENKAAIFFDLNESKTTNTVWHNVGKLMVSIQEPNEKNEARWRILGNPAKESCTFLAKDPIFGAKQFVLTDASGKVVQQERFTGQEFSLLRGQFPSGMYFFTIITARDGVTSGKIIFN